MSDIEAKYEGKMIHFDNSNKITVEHEKQPIEVHDTIRSVLERNRLAVLATQRSGQPHASLIAFTPSEGIRSLIFATYRDTLKYNSICEDRRVAILIEDREGAARHSNPPLVLTAVGEASKLPEEERHVHLLAHLERHPELVEFLSSLDCEFVRVSVQAYQVVSDINHVQWYTMGYCASSAPAIRPN